MGMMQVRPTQVGLFDVSVRQEVLRKTKRLETLRDLDFVVSSHLGLV